MQPRIPIPRAEVLLFLMAAAVPLSFATWMALIDNFAIHRAGFGGEQIGLLQSLREVPGFLAFAVVFVLLLMREQTLACVARAVRCVRRGGCGELGVLP